MEKLGTIKVGDDEVTLFLAAYGDGTPAVIGQMGSGEPYGKLSVNPAGRRKIPAGHIAVKTWSENVAFAAAAERSGLFEPSGYPPVLLPNDLKAPVWKVKGH